MGIHRAACQRVDKIIRRVKERQAADVQDVGDPAGIVSRLPAPQHAVFERHGHDQQREFVSAAEFRGLVEPVSGFIPFTTALHDLEGVTEIIGEDALDHEMRVKPLGKGQQRGVILLGRVAQATGVEQRDFLVEAGFEIASQVFNGCVFVVDEHALHEGIAEHDAAEGCVAIGLGPTQTPGVGGGTRVFHNDARGSMERLCQAGTVGHLKEHEHAAFEREIADPD